MVAGQQPNATYADDMDSSVYDILRERMPIQIAIDMLIDYIRLWPETEIYHHLSEEVYADEEPILEELEND
tara:strand:- start:631 stop:843 length:213 start_codon:yes stop_codon:yes gene_type:complete